MNGVIIVDKPKNFTSRDIVNIIGKKYKTKKVGHTGTLDPLATGVLIVCVNKATKIAELITAVDKEYIAEIELGTLTDTLDITGKVLKDENTSISKEKIEKILNKIIGIQNQIIPLYSAVKINGKKLYEYARNGEEIELPTHEINIKSLELLDIKQTNKTTIKIKTNVSKGTYIRSMARDIGEKLGTYGTMTSLRRTKQGNFSIDDALLIDDVTSDTKLIPIEECLDKYFKVIANNSLIADILDGKIIDNTYGNDEIFFVDKNNEAIALYKKYDREENKIKPWKMFKIKK